MFQTYDEMLSCQAHTVDGATEKYSRTLARTCRSTCSVGEVDGAAGLGHDLLEVGACAADDEEVVLRRDLQLHGHLSCALKPKCTEFSNN